MCDALPTLDTTMEIIIVRHWREQHRTSNTARLAALAIPRCRVLDWDLRDETFDLGLPTNPDTRVALLFPPDGEEHGMPDEVKMYPEERPDVLLVMDGTWRQTRRMVRRIKGVQGLPRVFLAPISEHRERLRTPPKPWAMSTVEAVARAIAHYESDAQAAQLDEAYSDFLRRLQAQRGGPIPSSS